MDLTKLKTKLQAAAAQKGKPKPAAAPKRPVARPRPTRAGFMGGY